MGTSRPVRYFSSLVLMPRRGPLGGKLNSFQVIHYLLAFHMEYRLLHFHQINFITCA